MKTASKVFLIIGMVFGAVLIFPIVLGILAYQKLDEAKNQEEIQLWAILSLLFVNIIAGILMLCLNDKDFEMNKKNIELKSENISSKDIFSRIDKLYELKEKNVITSEEFESLKKELLAKI